jgi:pantetheine-phosphate adenylyltransferase
MERRMSPVARDAERIAVYPGAFDPVHLGHLDIARRAAAIFDRLLVAVYDRPNKRLAFSGEERIAMFRRGTADLENVEVVGYAGLTIDFARERGAGFLVRGLRTTSDYDYENQMNIMNRQLAPGIDSVFLLTSALHAHLSSSLIKEVAAQGAPLVGLVPDFVAAALRDLYGLQP